MMMRSSACSYKTLFWRAAARTSKCCQTLRSQAWHGYGVGTQIIGLRIFKKPDSNSDSDSGISKSPTPVKCNQSIPNKYIFAKDSPFLLVKMFSLNETEV